MALTDLAPLNRTHTAPPSHGMPLLILLRLRLRPLQVQGAALPINPLLRRFVARATLEPALH